MRLGILGPANGDVIGLARAAQILLDEAHAERVIYVGDDGALEQVVVSWASEIVGANPTGEALFKRAAARCARALPDEIDQFVEGERARLRLEVFVSLPSGHSRTIEILDGRVVLFVYDKAMLDEEDIFSASFLIYGKSDSPLIRKIGPRWFLSPGPVDQPGGGAIVLDDSVDPIAATLYDTDGLAIRTEVLATARAAKMSVQG